VARQITHEDTGDVDKMASLFFTTYMLVVGVGVYMCVYTYMLVVGVGVYMCVYTYVYISSYVVNSCIYMIHSQIASLYFTTLFYYM